MCGVKFFVNIFQKLFHSAVPERPPTPEELADTIDWFASGDWNYGEPFDYAFYSKYDDHHCAEIAKRCGQIQREVEGHGISDEHRKELTRLAKRLRES